MILFIKHIDIEGPETFSSFLKGQGIPFRIIELQNGEKLPEQLDGIDAVISLGGPMNVYEEDKYPFLLEEDLFLKKTIAQDIPFIGICLGSQLLAKACGITVGKSPEKEIGFAPVHLAASGAEDPLFKGIEAVVDVFHWHEDMSELSRKEEPLAYSQGCPVQAFKIGSCAYGLQFHIEVTESTIQQWASAYFSSGNPVEEQHKLAMVEDYHQKKEVFHQIAQKVYNNFLEIVKQKNDKIKYLQHENSSCTN